MTIQEMKERKRELGYSNDYLSRITGIPVPTIQKIFGGTTKSPRQATIQALEKALSASSEKKAASPAEGLYTRHTDPCGVAESKAAYAEQKRVHTIEEIYALPDGVRAELIDGQIYYMASPARVHQEIAGEMFLSVANYIRARGGRCKVYIPPFAVFLFGDDSTYVEPDLTVVCDTDKLDDRGCVGAPDWVTEVLSPSSTRMDCLLKLFKYRTAGVREYWIVDPKNRTVTTYLFNKDEEEKEEVKTFSFADAVPCSIFPELTIRLADVV